MSPEEVGRILPHRFEALLVRNEVVVNTHDHYGFTHHAFSDRDCQGHFPDNLVVRAVDLIELVAQTLGVVGVTCYQIEGQPFFRSVRYAKFTAAVRPDEIVRAEAYDVDFRIGLLTGSGEITRAGERIAHIDQIKIAIVPKPGA